MTEKETEQVRQILEETITPRMWAEIRREWPKRIKRVDTSELTYLTRDWYEHELTPPRSGL